MIFKTFRGNIAFYCGVIVFLSVIVSLLWADRQGYFQSPVETVTETPMQTCPVFCYWNGTECVADEGHELWCLYHDEESGECASLYTLPFGMCVNGEYANGDACTHNKD